MPMAASMAEHYAVKVTTAPQLQRNANIKIFCTTKNLEQCSSPALSPNHNTCKQKDISRSPR